MVKKGLLDGVIFTTWQPSPYTWLVVPWLFSLLTPVCGLTPVEGGPTNNIGDKVIFLKRVWHMFVASTNGGMMGEGRLKEAKWLEIYPG